MKKPIACLLFSLLLPLAACADDNRSAELRAELDEKLDTAPLVYHGGCDQLAACALDNRSCEQVATAMIDELSLGQPVLLEWEAPDTVVGIRSYYYQIEADGSGSFYSEYRTDISGSDCGSYCGWHREDYVAGTLFDGTELHLAPSGNEIEDLSLCDWP